MQPNKFVVRLSDLKFGEDARKFDPNQPRIPAGQPGGGRWTDGDDAVADDAKGEVRPFDRNELTDDIAGEDLDTLHEKAASNQDELNDLGASIRERTGLSYIGAPVKKRKRILEKLEEDPGYSGPHDILDMSRATFTVDTPADADRALAELAKSQVVHDKGWKLLKGANYLDRKVYIKHANGGVSEIQLIPRKVFGVKEGRGHALYQIIRDKASTPTQVNDAIRESAKLYGKALEGSPFEGLGR